jgi:hypothetical protein
VLLGQGYRTPRGAVIDKYGNGEMMISRGNRRTGRKLKEALCPNNDFYYKIYLCIILVVSVPLNPLHISLFLIILAEYSVNLCKVLQFVGLE